MTKAVMVIKESSATEVIDELKDVISKEPVLIKIVSDTAFNLQFGKTTDIPVDLPEDQLLALSMEAHNKDITLNQHINEILLEQLTKEKSKVSFVKGLNPIAETSMKVKEEFTASKEDVQKAVDDLLD